MHTCDKAKPRGRAAKPRALQAPSSTTRGSAWRGTAYRACGHVVYRWSTRVQNPLGWMFAQKPKRLGFLGTPYDRPRIAVAPSFIPNTQKPALSNPHLGSLDFFRADPQLCNGGAFCPPTYLGFLDRTSILCPRSRVLGKVGRQVQNCTFQATGSRHQRRRLLSHSPGSDRSCL